MFCAVLGPDIQIHRCKKDLLIMLHIKALEDLHKHKLTIEDLVEAGIANGFTLYSQGHHIIVCDGEVVFKICVWAVHADVDYGFCIVPDFDLLYRPWAKVSFRSQTDDTVNTIMAHPLQPAHKRKSTSPGAPQAILRCAVDANFLEAYPPLHTDHRNHVHQHRPDRSWGETM
jgi:hypothetical protein